MDENQANSTVSEEVSEVQENVVEAIDKEALTNSIIDKVKNLFKKEEPPIEVVEQAKSVQSGEADIEAIVAQRVREEVDRIAENAKEKARQSLEEKAAELTAKEKAIRLKEQFLEMGIAPQFQDYIKHEVESKGIELEAFIAENPQFIQQQPKSTQVATNIKTKMGDKDAEYLEWLRKRKSFK